MSTATAPATAAITTSAMSVTNAIAAPTVAPYPHACP